MQLRTKTKLWSPDYRAAKTKDKEQLEGPHMLHNMKYESEDLLGMKTKVSTVKGTKEGRVQTVEAFADSGASASIISWDLAKKVNMIVLIRVMPHSKMEATSTWM